MYPRRLNNKSQTYKQTVAASDTLRVCYTRHFYNSSLRIVIVASAFLHSPGRRRTAVTFDAELIIIAHVKCQFSPLRSRLVSKGDHVYGHSKAQTRCRLFAELSLFVCLWFFRKQFTINWCRLQSPVFTLHLLCAWLSLCTRNSEWTSNTKNVICAARIAFNVDV